MAAAVTKLVALVTKSWPYPWWHQFRNSGFVYAVSKGQQLVRKDAGNALRK
jgi:hypothetical protein